MDPLQWKQHHLSSQAHNSSFWLIDTSLLSRAHHDHHHGLGEEKREEEGGEGKEEEGINFFVSLAFVLMDDSTFMVERLALAGEWDSLQNAPWSAIVHDNNVLLLITLLICLLAPYPHSGHNIDKHSR